MIIICSHGIVVSCIIYSTIYWLIMFYSQEQSNACGNSHWQAAKTNSRSYQTQDETGAVVACCNHAIMHKAINMFQGEIYAYPLFLQYNLAKRYNISFFAQDVICRYWPWLGRLCIKIPGDAHLQSLTTMSPFLSVMHGKAHDWKCQV